MRPLVMPVSTESIRKAIDAAAAVTLGVVCLSGSALHNVQPANDTLMGFAMNPMTPSLFGLTAGQWSVLHDGASIVFLALILPNIYWGWGRIAGLFRKGEKSGSAPRAAAGVFAALMLGAFLFGGVNLDLEPGFPPPTGAMAPVLGEGSDVRLARMTLEQAERDLGISTEYMRANLGLPAGVPKNVPFGELMRKNRFTIDDVRNVIIMNQVQSHLPAEASPPH